MTSQQTTVDLRQRSHRLPTANLLLTVQNAAGDTILVTPHGESDLASRPQLVSALEGIVEQSSGRRVIVDLDSLDFMDASTLSVLAMFGERSRQQGTCFSVRTARPLPRRLLRIGGLEHLLVSD